MALYEIVIGNNLDDTNYSKLVLSNEPLSVNNINIYAIAQIDKNFDNILEVKNPTISVNAWDAFEFQELDRLRKQL